MLVAVNPQPPVLTLVATVDSNVGYPDIDVTASEVPQVLPSVQI